MGEAPGVPGNDVADALALLHEPGEVFEVRILNTPRSGTVSGYFDDPKTAAREIGKWDGRAPGVYVTLNPVDPALMARAANHLRERVRDTTKDPDVLRRRWLLIDIDYHRPAGISATDSEVKAAWTVLKAARRYLEEERGWPAGIVVMSGNGGHVLYRIDLPNDVESRDLVKRFLEKLAARFDAPDGAQIDTTVHNAARIAKVPGTMACKGDSTAERPHRRAKVMSVPAEAVRVPAAALLEVAGPPPLPALPASPRVGGNGKVEFDVEAWMTQFGLTVRTHKAEAGGDLWELQQCPFNPEHDKGEAFITRNASGALLAGCHHASCEWHWGDLREKLEPGYLARQSEWERGRAEALSKDDARPAPRVLDEQPEEDAPPSPFIDWATFWVDEEAPDWVFPDVLAWGRGHALYATHKAGKSLLALYISAKVATDSECHVLYVDYEMTERDVRDRLAEMGYGPQSDLTHLHYALLPKMPFLDTEAGGEALVGMLDLAAADCPEAHFVVVIDTVSRAVKGEENSADTWRFFYNYTGMRLKQRGVTWMRLDHAGKDAERGQRGSSGKGDDVDIVWRLTVTQNGVQLKRELSRIGWVPERVTLLKKDSPILHYIRAASDSPAGTLEIVELLDSLGLPADATNAQARKALREKGHPAGNDVIAASVRWRQMAFRASTEQPPQTVLR